MRAIKMVDRIDQHRRRFLGTAALAAATQLGMVGPAAAQSSSANTAAPAMKPGRQTSFGSLKQIDAGVLNVGSPAGPPMVPRFFFCTAGLTTSTALSMSPRCLRQQVIGRSSRICADTAPRAFSRAIRSATASRQPLRRRRCPHGRAQDREGSPCRLRLGGAHGRYRRGLWPERCKALVSVSGYLIGSQEAGKMPLPPKAELQWWYQYYFATERGRAGYEKYRREFSKLIWQLASPKWDFDDATFERSAAAFDNPDHVGIVIHNYRWRLGLAEGEPQYDDLERRLAACPTIAVPTITLEGDANGAPHPDPGAYAKNFSGRYAHRTIAGGIGHNLPQEAPRAFADAVMEVAQS